MEFDVDIDALKAAAFAVAPEQKLSEDCEAGGVGAALLCDSGDIYTGICIDASCGIGFCAEHAAIAEMLKDRRTRIIAVIAVNDRGEILAPCGRCRELIYQIDKRNGETQVILPDKRVLPLRDLLPWHWSASKKRNREAGQG
jgi:cytidine deaminase